MLEDFYNKHRHSQYLLPKLAVADFDEITLRSQIPYLKIQIPGPWSEILQEAKNLDSKFIPHRDNGQTQGWSSICLHGLGWDKTDTPAVYPEFENTADEDLPWDWTEIAKECPVAYDYFKNQFPFSSYLRLRFMKLSAGGYIGPHCDGTGFMLGAVNISLNNPLGCEMILENVGPVPFDNHGSVMLFNNSYQHMVWNQSSEHRYHVIVHGTHKWEWTKLVETSYELAVSEYQK